LKKFLNRQATIFENAHNIEQAKFFHIFFGGDVLDYDYIFELDEFADYPDEVVNGFQKLLKRVEGKGVHEAAPMFARFHASLPPENRLNRKEQMRAISVIMDNLTPRDREKFRKIIDFLESN
jgi:hypothetical protein